MVLFNGYYIVKLVIVRKPINRYKLVIVINNQFFG